MKNFPKFATQSTDRDASEAQVLSKGSSIARGPRDLGVKGPSGQGAVGPGAKRGAKRGARRADVKVSRPRPQMSWGK